MTMQFAKPVNRRRGLAKEYGLIESEHGGVYFEIGDYASDDFTSRTKAIAAAREHRRLSRQQSAEG